MLLAMGLEKSRCQQVLPWALPSVIMGKESEKSKLSIQPPLENQAGFTLLEVLVALAILGVALAVIFQIFSANLRTVKFAEDDGYAAAKAAARMRFIVDQEPPSEATSWTETTDDGYNMDVSISEYMADRTENLPVKMLQIDLTIHWLRGTKPKSLTLRTVKTVHRSLSS